MPIPLVVAWIVLGALSALLGLVNLVQVPLGRQVFAPSRSKRTPTQIRRQSLAAAVAMLGCSASCLGFLSGSVVTGELGFVFAVAGCAALILIRRTSATPS